MPTRKYSTIESMDIITTSDAAVPIVGLLEPIWEKQPGETDEEYTMFLTFSAFAPTERTIQHAWERWSGKKTRMSGSFYDLWKVKRWELRAAQWDIDKLKEVQKDWITRDEARRNEDYEIANKLREKALAALAEMDHDELTPMTMARFIELASRLQADSIPQVVLQQEEINQLMSSLPPERRKSITAIIFAKQSG